MHTTATPGAGTSNPATPGIIVTNPNPAAGTIVVQMQDNFMRAYTGGNAIVSPIGTPTGTLTAGVAYIVITVGTTTSAQWLAAGIPAGVLAAAGGLPAVGTAFISAITGAIGGTGTAAPTAAAGSGVASIETVGDSTQALAPLVSASQGFGGQLILQCRDYAGALVAPADGSVISLSFLLSNSSVLIAGE